MADNRRAGYEQAGEQSREYFDGLWRRGDYWKLESSAFEHAKYEHQRAFVNDRHYARALEIGCGAGGFTHLLAPLADHVTGLDVAPVAIERARAVSPAHVVFRVENVVEHDFRSDAPWDLVVMSETIYYLGWLYTFFEVAWLAKEIFNATSPGGRFVMANTRGGVADDLLQPWIIQTYRDLFLNAGFAIEREEVFRGEKKGVALETLISMFHKAPDASGT